MGDIEQIRSRWSKTTTGHLDDVAALLAAVDERDAELVRLRAQVASTQRRTYSAPPEAWPDDSEINQVIAEAETFNGALFEIADKYGSNVTNNMPRWQGGEFMRDVGDFIDDVRAAVDRFLVEPAVADRDKRMGAIRVAVEALEEVVATAAEPMYEAQRAYLKGISTAVEVLRKALSNG